MSEIFVTKAGGTSNSDAAAVEQTRQMAMESTILVTSAPGRLSEAQVSSYSGNFAINDPNFFASKITDQLLSAHEQFTSTGLVNSETTESIQARFDLIVAGLGIKNLAENGWVQAIPSRVRDAVRYGQDYASMLGEILQAEIYQSLGMNLLNPSQAGHSVGSHDKESWHRWLSRDVQIGQQYILPGNIWFDGERLHTFDRGGSDISGALAAYGIGADAYFNNTDTTAKSADPRLIPAERLRTLNYLAKKVARELGINGTGLLHPEAIIPLMDTDIDIILQNTFEPESGNTRYSNEMPAELDGKVLGVSLMDVVIIDVDVPGTSEARGSIASLAAQISSAGINTIDIIGDGADSELIIVHPEEGDLALDALRGFVNGSGEVTGRQLELVTLAGQNLRDAQLDIQNTLAQAEAFGKNQRPVYPLIGKHSIRFAVTDGQQTVDRAHRALIENAA